MAELKIALEALYRSEHETIELGRRAQALPVSIADKREQAAAARALVAAGQEKLDAAEQGRRAKEGELSDTEAQHEKFQGQTALVKTNEEYTTLLAEIDHAGERVSQIEEEILIAMDEIETLAAGLEELRVEKKREEDKLEQQAKALEAELAEVRTDLERHDAERAQLARELPAPFGASYERLFQNQGSGLARVEVTTCSACHRQIPPETINQLIGGEVTPCLSCQRLLVFEQELEA